MNPRENILRTINFNHPARIPGNIPGVWLAYRGCGHEAFDPKGGAGTARIVEEGAAYYPVISRVVGREYVFATDAERERFRAIMRAVEAFSGVRILTWAILSNHFHIQVHNLAIQGLSQ